MLKFLAPHLRVERVEELTLERLREMDIEFLLLDVDCTLKRYRAAEVTPEVDAWMDELRSGGIQLCLASNGLGKRIGEFAGKVDLPFFAKALKPFPFRIRKAMRRMGYDPKKTAMVGDQLFADVIAGRLAGLTSILVRPIHPEEEHWFTRVKRPPERLLLRLMGTAEKRK